MIPLHTTTVEILRDSGGDALDRGAPAKIAGPVRAVISGPSGAETVTAGSSERADARLTCDPCEIRHGDVVRDLSTGDEWRATFARRRIGFGLDHMTAGLVAVTDRAAVNG